MKVLFCHDGPIGQYIDGNYYCISNSDKTFKRYYSIADELQILNRTYQIDNASKLKKLSKITLKPFEVISVPNFLSIKSLWRIHESKKVIYKAVKNADYVVARVPSMISNFAIDAARQLQKPYIVEVVACPWDAFWNHSVTGKLCAPYMYYAMKKRVFEAPSVIYVTNNFLQQRYPSKGKCFVCSDVSLNRINDEILEERIQKIFGNSKKQYIIGTLAAIDVKYKGQQYVIRALGKLKKQGITNFKYEIVGSGDPNFLKKEIKKNKVEDLVTIKGTIPHENIFEWLDSIDIYAQPSRQEGLPRALVEAMSRALPAFGANTGGIPELIDEKYIFSNSKRNINEICDILLGFTESDFIAEAKKNFERSKNYDMDLLENTRMDIFCAFKDGKI